MTQTTWAIRFWCPECGYEGFTQDSDLADAMLKHHHRRVDHDAFKPADRERVDDVPLSAFPDSEDPQVDPAVSVTSRALEVTGGD